MDKLIIKPEIEEVKVDTLKYIENKITTQIDRKYLDVPNYTYIEPFGFETYKFDPSKIKTLEDIVDFLDGIGLTLTVGTNTQPTYVDRDKALKYMKKI